MDLLKYEEKNYLKDVEEFLTISDMKNLNYTESLKIYKYGFLLTDYLINTYGFDKFMTLSKELHNYEYIDKRSEHKMQILSELSTKALEKIYGSTKQLSKDYVTFFDNKMGKR